MFKAEAIKMKYWIIVVQLWRGVGKTVILCALSALE